MTAESFRFSFFLFRVFFSLPGTEIKSQVILDRKGPSLCYTAIVGEMSFVAEKEGSDGMSKEQETDRPRKTESI